MTSFSTHSPHTTYLNVYFLVLFGLLLNTCAPSSSTSQEQEADNRPPNIIYILADDLGYGDLGCYGQNVLSSPHIDQLAAEGMRFTQHYSGATVCAPSRASLITGKQPGKSSVRGNGPVGQILQPEEITLPEAIKSAGYRSAIIGKWGIGNGMKPDDPLQNGFDEAYGYINMWHAHNFFPEFLYKNGKKVLLEGNETDWSYAYREGMPEGTGIAKEKQRYTLFEFEREAMDFIERNKDNSFFLYLALNMPHANNEAGSLAGDGMEVPMRKKNGQWLPDYGQFENKDWPNPEKGFARMIELIDETVGKVERKLTELNLNEKTLIIFTSDNGPHQEGKHQVDFFDSNSQLRGKKRDLYEGGIRVPMIAKWTGNIPAGTMSHHQSAFWDIMPTFCEIAGVAVPEAADGVSFLPTLLEKGAQKQASYLYWEFYEQGGKQAIRQGDWKYIKLNVRDPRKAVIRELYKLDSDLAEENNLVDQYPELVSAFEEMMEEAHTEHALFSLFDQ